MSKLYRPGSIVGCLGALTLLLAACGGEWEEYAPSGNSLPSDKVSTLSYPTGPHGTRVGDVVADIRFKDAMFDPDMHCKNLKDWDLTALDSGQTLSMSDVFQGDAFCGSKPKQFLLLMSTAGW
jgi:hypothetical protein